MIQLYCLCVEGRKAGNTRRRSGGAREREIREGQTSETRKRKKERKKTRKENKKK